jgi:outer membrane protein TolC
VRAWCLLLLAVCVAAWGLGGCSRAHYRTAADRDTYPILAERVVYPQYDIGPIGIDPPPASRLADPFDPDAPPKPPDDPAAGIFMERPAGMRGSKHWEKDGVTDLIENPGWEMVLAADERGVILLDQERAVEVALLNSREYQARLESLYLVALALTLNRFEFDLQWFLTNSTTYTHFGSGGAAGGETNTLAVITGLGFTRNLAAGGQLLVDFANSLVYEYTGGSRQFRSNFLASLIQPLLRGAGRQVRLESLTQAERNTLYAVRDFARFRKTFWADVAVQNGGYLDLLLAMQRIRNNEANLRRQEETYRLYNELFLGGRASSVELDQFFQSQQAAQLQVIQSQTQFDTLLDRFKLRLGLPPRLEIELDDALLDEFIVADPQVEQQRDALETFQRERLAELDEPPSAEELRRHFETLLGYARRAPRALGQAEADVERWGEQLAEPSDGTRGLESHDRPREAYESVRPLLRGIAQDIAEVTSAIERHAEEIAEENRRESWETLAADIKLVLADYDAILAVQAQARIHLIRLPAIEISEDAALAEAIENRLDLQNQLAQVTDAWRRVTVAANALRADLDVVASMNLGTDPDHLNPFNFASEASSYSVGLRFDGPLNRLAERNVYRASLIAYQRARRDYMALSDAIEAEVRLDLRLLAQTRVGFEISRQQLLSAARQFENARIILLGPRDRRSANDTTTLNLLSALQALVQARNALAENYINYEQQRVQLLLDLEALQLDPRGFPLHDNLRPDRGAAASPHEPEAIGRPEPDDGTGIGRSPPPVLVQPPEALPSP